MGVCGGAVPAGGKILKSQLALDLLHKMTVELIFFTASLYSPASLRQCTGGLSRFSNSKKSARY